MQVAQLVENSASSRIALIVYAEMREDFDEMPAVDRALISDCNCEILAAFAGSCASSVDMEKLLSPVAESCSLSSWLSIRRT